MDSLNVDSLNQIEYLLTQSTQGIHLLFNSDELIQTLREPVDAQSYFTFENLNKVQDILTEMIQQPTIEGKRAYLDSLAADHFELLIRTYFNIVENTVLESHPHHH